MKVTRRTKWSKFEVLDAFITDESRQNLIQGAQEAIRFYGAITIDEFWGLMNGDYSIVGKMKRPTVLQVYWLRGFTEYVDSLTKAIERLVVPSDPNKEKIYQQGCVELSAQENMLVFVRDYFGLHSLYEAGRITIGEYLTARKHKFNEAMVQHNFDAAQRERLKIKK